MENEIQKDKSKVIFAYVLIAFGVLWMLRKIGININFPHIHIFDIFFPLKQILGRFIHFVFSWQMILIIIGLVLLAGKRQVGLVLIVVGGIFILPKLFFLPGLSISLLFPALLVGLGIAMVARLI